MASEEGGMTSEEGGILNLGLKLKRSDKKTVIFFVFFKINCLSFATVLPNAI